MEVHRVSVLISFRITRGHSDVDRLHRAYMPMQCLEPLQAFTAVIPFVPATQSFLKVCFVPVLVESILHQAAVEASDERTFPLSLLINTPGAESNPLYLISSILFLFSKRLMLGKLCNTDGAKARLRFLELGV